MTTICLDCRYIKPRPSGIAAVVSALVEHLPRLAPDWHFKLLRHASLGRPLSDAPNVTEVELSAEANSPASMWLLPRLVDLRDVDLFHSPSNILPRGLTMPCVTTIHDVMWLTDPELCIRRPWGLVEQFFYRHGTKHALLQSDAILTVSEATRSAILDLDPALSAKTITCLSGVSKSFQPQSVNRTSLQRFGIGKNPYVLTVGQSAPYKNHEGAIHGFALAFAQEPGLDLVIVQRQGGRSQTLKRLAKQLGLADRVHFLPPVDEQALAALYCGAKGLLHPSFCEGFGMPLAEAMASGCPVITSEVSAMPEVTGGAALLVNPRDDGSIAHALKRLVDEPELVSDLREKGLERAQQLDWQSFAQRNLEVYRQVLAKA